MKVLSILAIPQILLTAVQSRILLILLTEGGLGTASLLESVGVSGKTLAKEKSKLEHLGLLSISDSKRITKEGIKKSKVHCLTPKGVDVAKSVSQISDLLSEAS